MACLTADGARFLHQEFKCQTSHIMITTKLIRVFKNLFAYLHEQLKVLEETTGFQLTRMDVLNIIIACTLLATASILPAKGENLEGWAVAAFLAAWISSNGTMMNIYKQLK